MCPRPSAPKDPGPSRRNQGRKVVGLITGQTRCEQPHEGWEEAAVISQRQALGLAGHPMEMRRVRPPERAMSRGKGGSDCRRKEEHIRGWTPLGSRACTSLATDEGALAQRRIRTKGGAGARSRMASATGWSWNFLLTALSSQ